MRNAPYILLRLDSILELWRTFPIGDGIALLVSHTSLLEISCCGSHGFIDVLLFAYLDNFQFCTLFCHLLIFFFKINFTFSKIILGIPIERQKVGIQIRQDILLGLIWVQAQTVCKGYQQTTLL